MARADSVIAVAITGDAKSLGKAVDSADKKLGAFGGNVGKLGGLIAGAFAVDAVFDFAGAALSESDRVGDALAVLEAQLGDDITGALDEASEGFHDLGLSKGDVLELEAKVADLGTALGLTKDNIAELAPDLVTAAGALALIGDKDPAEVIGLIGKAAAGNKKALKELGIVLDEDAVNQQAMLDTGKDLPEQLTDTEKAAARYKLILEKLQPKILAVTEATPDMEQSQKELQARFETLTAKVGDQLQSVLTPFLQWILDATDTLGDLADEFDPTGEKLDGFADTVGEALFPLDAFLDGLNAMYETLLELVSLDLDALARRLGRLGGQGKGGFDLGGDLPGVGGGGGSIPGVSGGSSGSGSSNQSGPGSVRGDVVVHIDVQPTGAQTEAAVVKALRDYQARNGRLP